MFAFSFGLLWFAINGLISAMQYLHFSACNGDLVLLNNLLASRGVEVDYRGHVVWFLYFVVQGSSLMICAGTAVVCTFCPAVEHCGCVSGFAVQGCTPLSLAARFGHLQIVQALLAHGADVALRCSKV